MSERRTDGHDASHDAAQSRPSQAQSQPVASSSRSGLSAPAGPSTQQLKRRRAPFLPRAAQPEIIRANQKDLYYLGELGEQIEDAARSIFGTRWLQHWTEELSVFSRLAYFSLTTLLGSQTLGEEYCDILQYSAADRKAPSVVRRATLVLLHIVAPYACAKAYTNLRKSLRERRHQEQGQSDSQSTDKAAPDSRTVGERLRRLSLPAWEQIFDEQFTAIHLAIFYLTGRYYHASKRATGIRYLSTQSSSALNASQPPSYEILGLLMAIQLVARILLAIRSAAPAAPPPQAVDKPIDKRPKPTIDGLALETLTFDPNNPSPRDEEEEDPDAPLDAEVQARRCTLCLNTRKDPTATECGHVFCWECIVGWAREKAECPLCRQSIANLSALLPVYNL